MCVNGEYQWAAAAAAHKHIDITCVVRPQRNSHEHFILLLLLLPPRLCHSRCVYYCVYYHNNKEIVCECAAASSSSHSLSSNIFSQFFHSKLTILVLLYVVTRVCFFFSFLLRPDSCVALLYRCLFFHFFVVSFFRTFYSPPQTIQTHRRGEENFVLLSIEIWFFGRISRCCQVSFCACLESIEIELKNKWSIHTHTDTHLHDKRKIKNETKLFCAIVPRLRLRRCDEP